MTAPALVALAARTCKARRQKYGLRQSDLAAQCGVAEATIVRFERTGRVGLDVFARIAIALEIAAPMAELLDQATPKRPPAKTAKEFLRVERPRQRVRVAKAAD